MSVMKLPFPVTLTAHETLTIILSLTGASQYFSILVSASVYNYIVGLHNIRKNAISAKYLILQ